MTIITNDRLRFEEAERDEAARERLASLRYGTAPDEPGPRFLERTIYLLEVIDTWTNESKTFPMTPQTMAEVVAWERQQEARS